MKQQFLAYIKAIEREQAKRATTYPKMIAKRQKQGGMPLDEIIEMQRQMNIQNARLDQTLVIIKNNISIDASSAIEYLDELMREFKMRVRYYPRLIFFKRLDQTTADYEISTWKSLCGWFAKEYVGIDELSFKSWKTMKKANK